MDGKNRFWVSSEFLNRGGDISEIRLSPKGVKKDIKIKKQTKEI